MSRKSAFVICLMMQVSSALDALSDSSFVSQVGFPDKSVMSDIQHGNAFDEDAIANLIWLRLIDNGRARGCDALKKMVTAYAEKEDVIWEEAFDRKNPEYPKMCSDGSEVSDACNGQPRIGGLLKQVPASQTFLNENINNVLQSNRRKLSFIASRAACPRLLDMLGSPVPVVRNAAIWELVFKKVPKAEWDSSPGRDNMMDSYIVKAYNEVRCLGRSPCDKATRTAADGLSPMFRFAKGRGAAGARHESFNGGIAWPNRFQGRSNGRADDFEGSLENFWQAHGTHNNNVFDEGECTRIRQSLLCRLDNLGEKRNKRPSSNIMKSQAKCAWWKAYCSTMREVREQDHEVTKNIWTPAKPVKASNVREVNRVGIWNPGFVKEAGHVTYHFRKCGVPWVGGVSGSVLEFFAVLEKHFEGSIDDLVILQWMAYYELRGFHSLGEVWTALHPFLEAMGYSHDGNGNTHKLKLLEIQPPMTTRGCDPTTPNSESLFLTRLRKFVENYADELDTKYARTVHKYTTQSRKSDAEEAFRAMVAEDDM